MNWVLLFPNQEAWNTGLKSLAGSSSRTHSWTIRPTLSTRILTESIACVLKPSHLPSFKRHQSLLPRGLAAVSTAGTISYWCFPGLQAFCWSNKSEYSVLVLLQVAEDYLESNKGLTQVNKKDNQTWWLNAMAEINGQRNIYIYMEQKLQGHLRREVGKERQKDVQRGQLGLARSQGLACVHDGGVLTPLKHLLVG